MLNSKSKVLVASLISGLALTAIVAALSAFVFSFIGDVLPSLAAAGPLLALSVFFLKRQTKTDLTLLGVAIAVLILAVVSVLEPWEWFKVLLSKIILVPDNSNILLSLTFQTLYFAIQGLLISAVFLASYKLFAVFGKTNNKNIAIYIAVLILCAIITACGSIFFTTDNVNFQTMALIRPMLIFIIAFCPNAYMFMAVTSRQQLGTENKSE